MKYKNQSLKGPRVELLVIPRNGVDMAFQAKAIFDYTDFEKLCPAPVPPKKILPGQEVATDDVKDPTYKAAILVWQIDRFNWMTLQSLSVTEDLEWETVVENDKTTWTNWRKELQDAGFNNIEIAKIQNLATSANSADDEKLEEARARFLTGRRSATGN